LFRSESVNDTAVPSNQGGKRKGGLYLIGNLALDIEIPGVAQKHRDDRAAPTT